MEILAVVVTVVDALLFVAMAAKPSFFHSVYYRNCRKGFSGMTIRKSRLLVSGFAVLCALLLAAGALLPSVGRAYAEGNTEASAEAKAEAEAIAPDNGEAESVGSAVGAQATYKVYLDSMVAGQEGSSDLVNVKEGDTVPLPSNPPATIEREDGPATFRGWVAFEGAEWTHPEAALVTPDDLGKYDLYDFSLPVTSDMTIVAQYVTATTDVQVELVLDIPGYHPNTSMANQFLGWVKKGETLSSNPELAAFFANPYAHDGTNASDLTHGLVLKGWYTRSGDRIDLDTPIYKDESSASVSYIQAYTVWEKAPDDPANEPTVIPVSGTSGVTATGILSGANVPEDATVEVSADVVTSGAVFDELDAVLGDGALAGIFEVKLTVNGQQVHDGFGSLTVAFPVDVKYNGHWVTVWHRHNDGSITSERVIAANGAVAMTVTDLSTFALEVGELAASGGESGEKSEPSSEVTPLAKTGDPLPWAGFAGLAAAALAACGAAAWSLRKTR